MNRTFLTPLRVGLVVIGGFTAMLVLLSLIGRQKFGASDVFHYYANFKDATGIGVKSRVQVAGIEVGTVERIDLTGDARARLTLRIRKDIPLYKDARITKRSASLLGDFLLDIYPGNPAMPKLKDGDELSKVVATPGMEDVFAALGDVTRDIQGVTKSLKSMLDSDETGSIRDIIKSMNGVALSLNRTIIQAGGRLDAILFDAQRLTSMVRGLAGDQSHNVTEIIGNIRLFTDQANRVLTSINQIIGTSQGQLTESVTGVKDTLAQLQRTLHGAEDMIASAKGTVDSAHDVVNRIDRGEGTIGKLLRDDGIAVKLDRTLGDVNNLIAPISELQTQVQIRDELHWRPDLPAGHTGPSGKAGVQIRLIPRPDKFYGFELVSEPRGTVHRETVTSTNQQTKVLSTDQQTVTTTDDYKVSAYIGKRFGPAAFRIGLIESTGGVGADAYLWNDRIKFSVDAFDWANPVAQYPRLRASASFTFFDHVFIGLGLDDLLNKANTANGKVVLDNGRFTTGTDGYIQGGIQFTDDDLKSILALTGAPKP
jgi:phospholipid/cholesterol/gamma-HCH transport system substrate-binding protein